MRISSWRRVANVAGTAEPIYGPSALRSVAQQTDKTPFTELTKDDLKWVAMDSTCVETQTFYLFADSGHIGLAQIIYSNVACVPCQTPPPLDKSYQLTEVSDSGIRTTCQFNSKIFYPDGSQPHLWCSDPLDNYGFDAAKLNFFADDCAVSLADDGASYTIKSARNDKSLVDLKISRTAPGFQVGRNGTSYFGTDPADPWGSMRHVFWPRCKAEGSITTPDGTFEFQRGLFIMALQGMKPHNAAARWNFANWQGKEHSAVMMEFTTPASYGSSVVNVSGIAEDGEIVVAGVEGKATHTGIKDDPDWPEPSGAKFEWRGTAKGGEKVEAVVEGDLGKRIDKVDVMAEVPGFVKAIVGGVAG